MIRIPPKEMSSSPAIEPLCISAKDAARVLSISDRHLWQLTKDEKIPSVKIGCRVVYSVDALKDFVNQNRR